MNHLLVTCHLDLHKIRKLHCNYLDTHCWLRHLILRHPHRHRMTRLREYGIDMVSFTQRHISLSIILSILYRSHVSNCPADRNPLCSDSKIWIVALFPVRAHITLAILVSVLAARFTRLNNQQRHQ